jgi:pimeloyl-ACP methyl ester carboxylesterase
MPMSGSNPGKAGRSKDVTEEALEGVAVEEFAPYDEIELHGHRVGYRSLGDGKEVILLLHGITSTSEAWRQVMPRLAEEYTVIAPDLIGHGRSAKPRGDYSLGAYAAGVRDLLAVLGYERGTVVGHSFGGGIAMQFSYLFPEYVDRMVLVSSGGLGKEVHPLLRAATLPASEWVLPLIAREWPIRAGGAVAAAARPSSTRCAR